MSSFITAIVLYWDGEQGIAIDSFGEKIVIRAEEMFPDETRNMKRGSRLVIYDDGSVQLATQSFLICDEEYGDEEI